MKVKNYSILLLLLFSFFACSSSSDGIENINSDESYELIIASKTVNCNLMIPSKCLSARKKNEIQWKAILYGIKGFKHEKGFEYRLLVEDTPWEQNYIDGGPPKIKLIKILSKNKKL
ncbi:DUF4377 domain-containing protein [Tenacibaculum sp. nBUS_03]|uniref:DUF4377 domain-containing protein n=1 Tax=Tenacibaculum sp. nBUS_03 TaxID=3395320 RepID=UPI003EBE2D84